jgi:hypothetical protein
MVFLVKYLGKVIIAVYSRTDKPVLENHIQ